MEQVTQVGSIARDLSTTIFIRFSDAGDTIRKWSRERFDGATAFVAAGSGAPYQEGDRCENYKPESLPSALRYTAQTIYGECAKHVIEDQARILTDAAAYIESTRTNDQAKDEEIARLKSALMDVTTAAFSLSIKAGTLNVALDGSEQHRQKRQGVLDAMKAMERAFAKHGEALKDKSLA